MGLLFYYNLIPMPITLPNAATALTGSQATLTALMANAEATFVASTTVLINAAIANGFFQVQPFLIPFLTPTYVTTYFTNLGYVVSFPIWPDNCGYPGYPYEPCFAPPGFPEVLGNDYHNWSCGCGDDCGPPRIAISWNPPVP
jgi:hypothetical protein